MNTYDLITQNFDELYHHGIKGQKWGVRRFQNPDGSLTAEGKRRYGSVENFNQLSAAKANMQNAKTAKRSAHKEYNKEWNKARNFKNSYGAFIGTKKTKEAVAKQWEKTIESAAKAKDSNKTLKQAKKEYKNLKKSEKIESRLNKQINSANEERDRTMNLRQKNRERLQQKYINKGKSQDYIDNKLKDFDDGTRCVKAGYDFYSGVINSYKNAKVRSFADKSFKGSEEYKKAVCDYVNQKVSDMTRYGNRAMTILDYSYQYAVQDRRK